MIETIYQLVYGLNCNELEVLKRKEHLRGSFMQNLIEYKCRCSEKASF